MEPKLLAIVLALGLGACHSPLDAPPPPVAGAAIPVTTMRTTPSDRAPTVTLTGTLVADLEVALRTEAAGVVEAVRFVDGQAVRRGEVLVVLRDAEARAKVAEAEAALVLAEAEVGRATTLHEHQHTSAAVLDAARAQRALAAARLDGAREALRRTVLRAPFDGRLGTRDVAPGDTVDPARVVTTLVDVDPLRAEVDVPERLASWLKTGLEATVAVDADGAEPVPATVDYVGPAVATATRTVRARATLQRGSAGLRPGMTAQVTLQLAPATPVLRVPAEAVLTRADGAHVWTVEDGRAQLVAVRVGERLASDVVIADGLDAGDEVVVQGIARLRDGAEVKVLGDARAAVEPPAAPPPPEAAPAEAR